jgi:hypothetical protein
VNLNYRNKIQVYGLPRSGTNFIEWTLRNNFYNVDYNNIAATNEVKGSGPHETLLKHNYPTLDNSDGVIVIYKEFDEWKRSLKRAGMYLLIDEEAHLDYINRGHALDKDKVIVTDKVSDIKKTLTRSEIFKELDLGTSFKIP